jgi:asparagine synthase (glutamine-hydrolysing)
MSDVPIACSLSGGIDSSAIVGLMREIGYDGLQTYSIGFDEGEWDELDQARLVATRYETEHRELVIRPEDVLDELMSMVWALDEPYGGGLPSWFVFKLMGEHVTVGMTGTGGDELFGSYGKFVPFERGKLATLVRHGANPAIRGLGRALAHLPGGRLDDVARGALRDLGSAHRDPVRWGYFERAYYWSDDDKRRVLAAGADYTDTAEILREQFEGSGARTCSTYCYIRTRGRNCPKSSFT